VSGSWGTASDFGIVFIRHCRALSPSLPQYGPIPNLRDTPRDPPPLPGRRWAFLWANRRELVETSYGRVRKDEAGRRCRGWGRAVPPLEGGCVDHLTSGVVVAPPDHVSRSGPPPLARLDVLMLHPSPPCPRPQDWMSRWPSGISSLDGPGLFPRVLSVFSTRSRVVGCPDERSALITHGARAVRRGAAGPGLLLHTVACGPRTRPPWWRPRPRMPC